MHLQKCLYKGVCPKLSTNRLSRMEGKYFLPCDNLCRYEDGKDAEMTKPSQSVT